MTKSTPLLALALFGLVGALPPPENQKEALLAKTAQWKKEALLAKTAQEEQVANLAKATDTDEELLRGGVDDKWVKVEDKRFIEQGWSDSISLGTKNKSKKCLKHCHEKAKKWGKTQWKSTDRGYGLPSIGCMYERVCTGGSTGGCSMECSFWWAAPDYSNYYDYTFSLRDNMYDAPSEDTVWIKKWYNYDMSIENGYILDLNYSTHNRFGEELYPDVDAVIVGE